MSTIGLLALLGLVVVSAQQPTWPVISTWRNYRLDLAFYTWNGGATGTPIPDESAILLVNADSDRMRVLSKFRYELFGII